MLRRAPLSRTLAAAIIIVAAAGSMAVEAQQKPPQLILDSMAGPDLYRFYCASCHGADGKGRGPVAAALKAVPADLTTIARRNGGRFPRARLTAFVSSGELAVAAHGSQGMPVWGPIFRGLDPSEVRTTMRIDNLVVYIESIQEK
jgi:mono/diheme cytochrome c family protein